MRPIRARGIVVLPARTGKATPSGSFDGGRSFSTAVCDSAVVIDVALAATAVDSAATVLHYDSDFDHITAAYPQLLASWVVPRGSID